MPRNITDPNYDGTFEWQERVTDADGDSLSISVTVDGTDISNVSWADYTPTTNTINGNETEVLVDFTADRSGMTEGETYQFEVTADDGFATTSRTFTLEVIQAPKRTGSKLFAFDFEQGSSHDLSTPYSLSDSITNTGSNGERFDAGSIKPDGSLIIGFDALNHQWTESSLSTNWNLGSASETNTIGVSTSVEVKSVWVNEDGTLLFAVERNNKNILKYEMTTAWDIASLNQLQSWDVSTELPDEPQGVFLKPDGTKIYICGSGSSSQLKEYDLGSAFDLSNPSEANSKAASAKGIYITPNFLFLGNSSDIFKFKFGDSWDISTLPSLSTANAHSSFNPSFHSNMSDIDFGV
jgi:hypothetical protein